LLSISRQQQTPPLIASSGECHQLRGRCKRENGKCETRKRGTKTQGWKMREWKTRDRFGGVENGTLENAGMTTYEF